MRATIRVAAPAGQQAQLDEWLASRRGRRAVVAEGAFGALDAPDDVAVARLHIGRCLLALGDESSAERELTAARTAFRQVGATPLADLATSLLAPTSLPGGLTAREVEVLRLVASGRSNPQIAAELFLTVAAVKTHLRALFRAFGLEELAQSEKRRRLAAAGLNSGLVHDKDL